MAFDMIIRDARIVDGTGSPWQVGDIGIEDGRISAVGRLGRSKGRSDIDARGHFVSPGFINIHSHLDFSILARPRMEPSVRQGITTELGGQCGQSAAPTAKDDPNLVKGFYDNHWHGLALKWDWVSLGDFLDRLQGVGPSINFAMQVGHQNLRLITMGFECRPATAGEIKKLKEALRGAMRDGAFGMSSGIQWAPGFFCETEELIELAKVLAEYGGFYACHMRSEGDKLLEAVAEVLEIGEQARIPVQVSHLKASGKRNFGKVNGALCMIAEARQRGVDALVDTQPYGALDRKYAAENMWMRSCIPPWTVAAAGGFGNLQARLKDPEFRAAVRRDIEKRVSPDWHTRIVDCMLDVVGFENLVLGSTVTEKYKRLTGKSVAAIAKAFGEDPYDTYFDILCEETVASPALFFMLHPDDVRTVVTSPMTIPQTDAAPRHTHPRKYGCFPRYLTQYVRDEKLLSLEEAIRKITSFPAGRMGLADRGLVREGFWADLVVIDWENLEDRSNFDENELHPSGIEHVLVNGVAVIKNGKHTGARPGQVLRNVH